MFGYAGPDERVVDGGDGRIVRSGAAVAFGSFDGGFLFGFFSRNFPRSRPAALVRRSHPSCRIGLDGGGGGAPSSKIISRGAEADEAEEEDETDSRRMPSPAASVVAQTRAVRDAVFGLFRALVAPPLGSPMNLDQPASSSSSPCSRLVLTGLLLGSRHRHRRRGRGEMRWTIGVGRLA